MEAKTNGPDLALCLELSYGGKSFFGIKKTGLLWGWGVYKKYIKIIGMQPVKRSLGAGYYAFVQIIFYDGRFAIAIRCQGRAELRGANPLIPPNS